MIESLRFIRSRNAAFTFAKIATALMCAALLTGCGGSEKPSTSTIVPPAEDISASASPTATPSPATLGDIVWTSTINLETAGPGEKAASFPTNAQAIYAVLRVEDVSPGLTLTANWTYNNTPLSGVSATAVAVQATAAGWVEFHLTLTAGESWPVGTYRITVSQPNGQSASSKVAVRRAVS